MSDAAEPVVLSLGVESGLTPAPRRAIPMLLGLLLPGLGQAYLGYWRRAVSWAMAPMFVELSFVLLVMRLQLRPAYGLLVPLVVCIWLVSRFLARGASV